MDFFPGVARAITLPSAITHPDLPLDRSSDSWHDEVAAHDWSTSFLNPATRIDTLDHAFSHCDWAIDGAEPDGCQFWAIPSFARGRPLLRIDVYVGGIMFSDTEGRLNPQISLLRVLDLHKLPLVPPGSCAVLGVARHVCNALQHWSSQVKNFEAKYHALPFGSHILIRKLEVDPRKMICEFAPDHSAERQWLSVEALQTLWQLPESRWPPVVDHNDVRFKKQLRDSISLVEIVDSSGSAKTCIFKCVTLDVKVMYFELKALLTMKSHPHVQGPPIGIVTKQVRFGGKRGVCGFLVEYMPLGSLLTELMVSSSSPKISLRQRLRWTVQIVDAMLHVQQSPIGYYSDLRLSNIMLRPSEIASETDIVLIDFEQRTPWYTEAPPEVSWVDFLERLGHASDPSESQRRCLAVLDRLDADIRYANRHDVYDHTSICSGTAFLYLSAAERDKAMVYMIGKTMWRIFEGVPLSLEPASFDSFLAQPGHLKFPNFEATPTVLRPIITECVSTIPEWDITEQDFGIANGQLVLRSGHGLCCHGEGTVKNVQSAARDWWAYELSTARRYCALRTALCADKKDQMSGASMRPSLQELREQIWHLWIQDRSTGLY